MDGIGAETRTDQNGRTVSQEVSRNTTRQAMSERKAVAVEASATLAGTAGREAAEKSASGVTLVSTTWPSDGVWKPGRQRKADVL